MDELSLIESVKIMSQSSGFNATDDDIAIVATDIKRNKEGICTSYDIHINLINVKLKESRLKVSSVAVASIKKHLGKYIDDTINRTSDKEVVLLYTEAFMNKKGKYAITLDKKVIEL